MPIDVQVYGLLKDKLGDAKLKVKDADGKELEKTLLDVIAGPEGWYDKMENAVKIQTANADLVRQREDLEKRVKDFKAEVQRVSDERDALSKGSLSEKERKEFESVKAKGMTADAEARYNAVVQQLKEASDKLTDVNSKLEGATRVAVDARRNSATEALRTKLIGELSKHNINGQRADMAAMSLFQRGQVRADVSEDGKTVSNIFRQFNAQGQELASSIDKVVKEFADANEFLKDGTRKGGSGMGHEGAPGSGANDGNYRAMLN